METQRKNLVCCDFGGVICDNHNRRGDKDLEIPPLLDCFEVISGIVRKVGAESVYIISKCSEEAETYIKEWLTYHRFYAQTGALPENIRFCRERHQKAPIAQSIKDEGGYESVMMIDDRWGVLKEFPAETSKLILLNPLEVEVDSSYGSSRRDVYHISNWRDSARVIGHLLR